MRQAQSPESNGNSSSASALTPILLILSLVQTCLIVFLSFKIASIDARSQDAAAAIADAVPAVAPTERVVYTNAADGPSAEEIRAVIREEIATLSPPAPQRTEVASQQARPFYSDAEAEHEYALILNEIDAYILRGDMDEAEMAAMQFRIGKLPPTERRRAMGRIIKAIDAGTLNAQL